MTDQRLRELLEERVADVPAIDLVDAAWDRAVGVRRRRRAVGGVIVTVLAVVGAATAIVSGRGDEPSPPPATNTEAPGPHPKAERAGRYGGVPVWWAPPTAQEVALPQLSGTGLPEEIDLSETQGEVLAGTRAVAVFQLWGDQPGEVVVVGSDGASYSLDLSHLEPVSDQGGNESAPLTRESLSPDGRHAFFVQDRSLEVYEFDSATWTTIATPGAAEGAAQWSADGAMIRVQRLSYSAPYFDLFVPTGERVGSNRDVDFYGGLREGDEVYPPIRRDDEEGARGLFLAGPVTDPDGTEVSSVDALGAGGRTEPEALLAFSRGETDEGRWLQCCPVVGWIDGDTVLFESRWAEARILAWRVGTPDLYRVSDVRGWTPGEESFVASYADPDSTSAEPIDVTAERGPAHGGSAIWWAPSAEDEGALPQLGISPLPATIDLSEGLPTVPQGTRARGVFQIRDRIVVLDQDGTSYSLDGSHLDPVTDEEGNRLTSLGEVSAGGRHVFFVQESSLEVYDFRGGGWLTLDTPDWLAEGARWLDDERIWVPDTLGGTTGTAHVLRDGTEPATIDQNGDLWDAPGAQAAHPAVANPDPASRLVVQVYVVSDPMTRPDGRSAAGVEVLHVAGPDGSGPAGLAYPFVSGERGMGSIDVIGWSDSTQVLYWSASESGGRRILAWDAGTRWLAQVSVVTGIAPGEPMGSSFADLSRG